MKQNARHQVYIPPRQTQRLDRFASRPGASKTSVSTAAFELLFEHVRPANCRVFADPTGKSPHQSPPDTTGPLHLLGLKNDNGP